ncbi:hypothetical protein Psal006b_01964 [Piscirickettsia salmonis]|uniref:Kinase domain protein n=1 Tax=Piscirickettsia salmonis TaxID=1238 RepID=A0AAC8ZNU1_PISSA|nr:hypothetical protein [Piscirickettsia salmonis]AKP73649.1 hypothetical protein PSLF89_1835 [Piscirickettsia salmonis LF-89 = ATCC VR-1361]ALB22428.1 kinase domain protein [Piscirickettsia salmonis]ALY02496.1 hypothetical protein AWE47_06230 [Piscirickettsia salmonis]AMA42018.1 hypothetical protein AWJ11_06265 [Piscirickettsia salmonis]AOS34487.1 hypothetical protein AVM72_03425 [Piscirickettsia salmonis]
MSYIELTLDYWQELKNNPEVYKLLIDRAQELQSSDVRFRETMIALNQIGTLSVDDWQLIKENSRLQKSIILLGQIGVNLKADWRMLKEDLSLQKAIIALSQTQMDFKEDWLQLKANVQLRSAVLERDQKLQTAYYPKLKLYEEYCAEYAEDDHPKWLSARRFSQIARMCAKNYLMGQENSFQPLHNSQDEVQALSEHENNLLLRTAGTAALSALGLPLVWGLGKMAVKAVQGQPVQFLFLGATELQKQAESIKLAAPMAID